MSTANAQHKYENLLHVAEMQRQELSEQLKLEQMYSGKLRKQVTETITATEQLETNSKLADQLKDALEKAEQQIAQLQDKCINTAHSARIAAEERGEQAHRIVELTQALELLKMDKIYLSKEVESLQLQVHRHEEQNARLQNKSRDLKKSREDILQKLVKLKEEQKTNYEERLTAEVDRLRAHTAADLEAIRASSKEVQERDSKALREARDIAVSDLDRALAKLNESRSAYEELQLEYVKCIQQVWTFY